MKEIKVSGKTIRRVFYALAGGFIIAQSVYTQQWLGIMPGSYIAIMGIMGFGCAGGACGTGSCSVPRRKGL